MNLKNVEWSDPKDGVALLKVNRPDALNALNTATLFELDSILEDIADRRDVRVLIFTGAGEKSFIAGADISEMREKTPQEGVEFARLGHSVATRLENLPMPVIAAVNGFALGGGMEMAMACDFIWASEKALFGQPEVGLGIIPGFGGNFRLPKYVGTPLAKELIFSGRKVKAEEAKAMQIANRVFPAEGFLDAVVDAAREIAAQSGSAVREAKSLLTEFSESIGFGLKVDREIQAFSELFGSPDQVEGMGAFVEKRKPNYQ